MKLKIGRNDLLNPLQQVIGAIEKRQTLAALSHVLIEADEKSISLTATDLELTMVASFDHAADTPGKIAVPARKLFDICKALPDGAEISLVEKDLKLTMKSGRSRFTLACLAAADFPKIEDITPTTSFSINSPELRNLLDRTAFAMANQDVRYYLNGLLLEVTPEQVRAVATDGHRLSMCDAEVKVDTKQKAQIIVPRKGITELQRLLSQDDEEVTVQMSNNHIRVIAGNLEFTSKLIDGRFPDYDRVLPSGNDAPLLTSREELRQTLQRASILSNEKYRGIRLQLSKNTLNIQSNNTEQEEAEDELEVNYSGNDFEIGFNVQYILDVLGSIDGDNVEVLFKDPNSSILITDSEQTNARYVVMPMRL